MQFHGGNIFEAARELRCDWRQILDLSANINALGPPPAVRGAILRALPRAVHYPESGAPELRRALARRWGVRADNLLAGNGATDLIHFVVRQLASATTLLVVPTFSEFRPALAGFHVVAAPLDPRREYRLDLEDLSRRVRDSRADLVVFTNPNNPAGTVTPTPELRLWIQSGIPGGARLLVDESFLEFTGQSSLARVAVRQTNVLVLRSLTKFYALPGLRLGCLVGDRTTIERLAAVQQPWAVNVLAEQAAVAALADASFEARTARWIARERPWCWHRLSRATGLKPVPTDANFFLVHSSRPVVRLQAFLRRHRILIRNCRGLEGVSGEAFRFAVRRRTENTRFLGLLEEFYR